MKLDMISHIDAKIDSLGSSLKKIDDSLHMLGDQVNEIQQRVSSNEDDITELVKRVKVLKKENTDLKSWTEDAENRSRRSNLRFVGIPERAEAGDVLGFISHLIPKLLGEANFSVPPVIERCHRTGILDNVKAKGPRPILVKLQCFQDKLKIMKLARDKRDPLQYKARAVNQGGSLKDVQIFIYPDFSAGVVQRRREFDAVKKKLCDREIEYGLLFPCTLRITHVGKRHFFHTPGEAENFLCALSSINSSIDSDMAAD